MVIFLFLKTWWWLFLPIILYFPAKNLYLRWVGWTVWYKEKKWALYEIIPPAKTEKPLKAMEEIFVKLWGVYDGPNWRAKWCEGEFVMPFWFSAEIVSIGGEIHFYIRTPAGMYSFIETTVQSSYPEAEIREIEKDYAQEVPQDIPNEKYNLYAEDYKYWLDELIPIKTYKYFETSNPESIVDEKKIDPIYPLMEALSKLRQGEQFWFQIVCVPITNNEIPWLTMIKEKIDKLAKRATPKPKEKSLTAETVQTLLSKSVPLKEEKKEESIFPPEMRLTPGEREQLVALEEKKTKYVFKTAMRIVYLAERDKYVSPNSKIIRSYMNHFATNSNFIMFWNETRTKVHYFFRKTRTYKKKRDLFEKYVKRFPPKYPDLIKGTSILSTEELATLFHFPADTSSLPPSVPRVSVKKREAPPGIPMQ